MTEIEKKALALLNGPHSPYEYLSEDHPVRVLCRAIEAHEAFRQEVSDAVAAYIDGGRQDGWLGFDYFSITKPDPLREICNDIGLGHTDTWDVAEELRAALAARGLEIREIEK